MHKSFFPLFFISLAGVLVTVLSRHPYSQWFGLAAGLVPLAVYHFNLQRKTALTPTEVDSVYYFGFLITVITLVATALSIGLQDANQKLVLSNILLKFALGLVATGYALFARLQLLSKSGTQVELDVMEATQKLAVSVANVSLEFNKAELQVHAFVELSQQRMASMEQSLDSRLALAELDFEEHLGKAKAEFRTSLAQTTSESIANTTQIIESATQSFAAGVSSIMEEIGRIQTEAEAISFAKAAERIEAFSKSMESSLQSITTATSDAAREAAGSINELTTTVKKVQELANTIATRLVELESIEKLLAALAAATSALASISKTATDAGNAVGSLASKVELTESEIQERIIKPIASLDLPGALAKAQQTLEAAGSSVANTAGVLNGALPGLATAIEGLIAGIAKFERQAGQFSTSLAEKQGALDVSGASVVNTAEILSRAQPGLITAIEGLVAGISVFERQSSQFAASLAQRQQQLETAIGAVTNDLEGTTSLSELGPSARMAVSQLKALAVTAGQQASALRQQSPSSVAVPVAPANRS